MARRARPRARRVRRADHAVVRMRKHVAWYTSGDARRGAGAGPGQPAAAVSKSSTASWPSTRTSWSRRDRGSGMTALAEYDLVQELTGPTLPGHVYVHVPFCVSRCAYCDFFSTTDLSSGRVHAGHRGARRRGAAVGSLGSAGGPRDPLHRRRDPDGARLGAGARRSATSSRSSPCAGPPRSPSRPTRSRSRCGSSRSSPPRA